MIDTTHPCDPLPAIEFEIRRRVRRAGPMQPAAYVPPPRDVRIAARAVGGESVDALAAEHGLSRTRIQQILYRSDIPSGRALCRCAACCQLRRMGGA